MHIFECDVNLSIPYTYILTLIRKLTVYDEIRPVHVGMDLSLLKQLIFHDGIQKMLEINAEKGRRNIP